MVDDHDRLVTHVPDLDAMKRAHTLAVALLAAGSTLDELVRHLVAVEVPTTVARLVTALAVDAA